MPQAQLGGHAVSGGRAREFWLKAESQGSGNAVNSGLAAPARDEDDRPMFKLMFVFTVVIASVAGCGGESANSSPPATPADGVDFKFNGHDDEDEGSTAKDGSPDEKKDESSKSESESKTTTQSESAASSPPPHKACPGLKKSDCQITAGCAWHTDNKCVAQ